MSRLGSLAVVFAVLHAASPGWAQSTDAGSPPPPATPPSDPNPWFDEPTPAPAPAPAPAPTPGQSEEPALPPAPSPPAAVCAPECQSGEMCLQGKCVSACEPPCAGGEECSDAGKCVRSRAPGAPAKSDPWTLPSQQKKPGDYRHDGFYARLSIGGGYSWGSGNAKSLPLAQDAVPGGEFDVSGGGASFALFIGGTLPGGVAIGFAAISTAANEPTYETVDGSQSGGAIYQPLAGLFADWYPDPTDGFHVLSAVGLGGVRISEHDSVPTRELHSTGYAFAGGGGYDVFVGRNISLGGFVMIQHGRSTLTTDEVNDAGRFQCTAVTLELAMTYN